MKKLTFSLLALFLTLSRPAFADCSGSVSLDSKDLWKTPVTESYELSGYYFIGLQGIKLKTTKEPVEEIEYDFCEVTVLEQELSEFVCEGLDEASAPRFPKLLKVVERNKEFTLSAFQVDGENEVLFTGSVSCTE